LHFSNAKLDQLFILERRQIWTLAAGSVDDGCFIFFHFVFVVQLVQDVAVGGGLLLNNVGLVYFLRPPFIFFVLELGAYWAYVD
jgi:hypothetical protein